MVGSDEKVIFVNATPHTAQSMPALTFTLEDGGAQSSVEVITWVGPSPQSVQVTCVLYGIYEEEDCCMLYVYIFSRAAML